jgi:ATP-binding cassette, subfamily B, multidrug efflux pump
MSQTFAILRPYVAPYRWAISLSLIAVIASKLPQVALPKILQISIDHLQTGQTPPAIQSAANWLDWSLPDIYTLLFVYGVLYVGLSVLAGLFIFAGRWYMIAASRRIEHDIRTALFMKLSTLSTRFYQRSQSGDVISRTTNDMDGVRMMLGPGVMYSVNSVFSFAFAMSLMVSINWKLTLVSLMPVPILMVTVRYAGKLVHERYLSIQQKLGGLSARIQENLSGIRVVKAYAQESYEIAQFSELNEDFVEANRKLIRVQAAFFPSMMLLAGVGMVIAIVYGGNQVIADRITLGQLVQFAAYLGMLIWPTIAAGWVVNLFQRGTAALGRIQEVMTEEPEIADGPETISDANVSHGSIQFDHLSWEYEPDNPVLHDISLTLGAGESLGIVGPTGCGKSTLANLIPRILEPTTGTLLLDGTDATRIPVDNVRRAIGMVPQESFLFSDTIWENIRFGNADATDDEMLQSADIASLREEVEQFPDKWETLVGERGITLSGGQKQRVAIARALLCDARILILDDALSAVDTDTEARILDKLRTELSHRTTVIVAHRLSAVKQATHIIYLDDGRILEQGTHAQLVDLDGKYADLYRRQLLEEELEAA